MSKLQKTLQRLNSKPKDFTWAEMVSLMDALGVELKFASGSARKFRNPASGSLLNMHQPHPSNTLKAYQVRDAIAYLKQEGFVE